MPTKQKQPQPAAGSADVLQLQMQDFETIVQRANEAIIIYEAHRVIFANSKALEMADISKKDLIGADIFDFIQIKDHSKVLTRVNNRLTGRELQGKYEITLLDKKGNQKDCLISSNLIVLNGRNCVLCFLSDITMQKKVAAALLKSEAKYRQLIEESSDGILLLSIDGNFFDVNQRAADMFGYAKNELLKMNFSELLSNSEAESKPINLAEIVGNKTKVTQRELKRADGSEFSAEVIKKALPDSGIQVTIRDISERQDAEKRLRLIVEGTSSTIGEDFLKDLAKYLAKALEVNYVLITQRDSTEDIAHPLVLWSKNKYEHMPCYPVADTPCSKVWETRKIFTSSSAAVEFPKDEWLVENEIISYIGMPLIDSKGIMIGHMAVMHDKLMKDLSVAESIIRIFGSRASAELERKATDEKLTQLYDRQSKLFSSIAHSLKTPFTVILGNVNMLEKNADSENQELLEGIKNNISMANEKVTQLLKVAQLDMSPIHSTDEVIDVDATLSEIATQAKYLFQGYFKDNTKSVVAEHLQSELSSKAEINADKKSIADLLLTLIDNAFKHSPEQGELPTVKISSRTDGQNVVIEVADTGKGIATEHLSHIFDLYYQVDSRKGGFGIGLAFCKKLTEALKGTITVESEVGKGTTFSIKLPKKI